MSADGFRPTRQRRHARHKLISISYLIKNKKLNLTANENCKRTFAPNARIFRSSKKLFVGKWASELSAPLQASLNCSAKVDQNWFSCFFFSDKSSVSVGAERNGCSPKKWNGKLAGATISLYLFFSSPNLPNKSLQTRPLLPSRRRLSGKFRSARFFVRPETCCRTWCWGESRPSAWTPPKRLIYRDFPSIWRSRVFFQGGLWCPGASVGSSHPSIRYLRLLVDCFSPLWPSPFPFPKNNQVLYLLYISSQTKYLKANFNLLKNKAQLTLIILYQFH